MVKDNPKTMTPDEMKANEIVTSWYKEVQYPASFLVPEDSNKLRKVITEAIHSERQKQRERDSEKVLEGVDQHNPNSMIAQYLRGKAQAILSQEDLDEEKR